MMTSDPRWLRLLRAEADKTSIGRAAIRVGYSRTAVSQALSGKYPGDMAKLERMVLNALELPMAVACPHLLLNLPTTMCHGFSSKAAPTHNPVQMMHWRACQICPNKSDATSSSQD
ncbi:XRE family transcriptional regulator [Duganella sp. CY15W]|uniref:helix-turn-helix domain-containing protein n=1 Tax=Duganella sp. CY15W TaxID=2692172 RepID=UPI0013689DA2|nr:LysR family transcriptional regulator [Duganella sp. CY15W]MYM32234.1 XRE family transcriptional regulator [Duganella sp. CY15W]